MSPKHTYKEIYHSLEIIILVTYVRLRKKKKTDNNNKQQNFIPLPIVFFLKTPFWLLCYPRMSLLTKENI